MRIPRPPASRSSNQRTSAWPPFSWGRMYGTYWSVTVERKRPTSCPSLPIRVRLVRPRAEPLELLEAGHRLEDRPDPRQVGQLGRDLGRFLDEDCAAGEAANPLLVPHDAPGPRPDLAP